MLKRSISMTIYLYKKTHNLTGLKYLGQTKKQDPYSYQGSGKYWRLHIAKHGYDVTTEILRECETMTDIERWGKYYSNLWNIVRSNEWANLKPELGEHGWTPPKLGSEHPGYDHTKYHFIHESGIERIFTRQEFIKEFNLSPGNLHTLIHGNWIVYNGWRLYKNKNVDYKEFKSKTNSRYDNKIYHFIHINGTEEHCTQWELRKKYNLGQGHTSALARRDRKSYKGWKLFSAPEGSDG
jgi:hypothetical protein